MIVALLVGLFREWLWFYATIYLGLAALLMSIAFRVMTFVGRGIWSATLAWRQRDHPNDRKW